MSELKQLSESLQNGDMEAVRELTAQALDAGLSPAEILSDGLIAGMNIVGVKFKNNELFLRR